MSGRTPKVKPGLGKKSDFNTDGLDGLAQTSRNTPPIAHQSDLLFPPLRLEAGAAAPLAGANQGVTISMIDEIVKAASAHSFADYWVPAQKRFGQADARGIRMYKQRQYVAVAEDYFVQVVRDAESGEFRATVASERNASGPQMQPDESGKYWRPVERATWLSEDGGVQSGGLATIDERLAKLYPTMTDDARRAMRRDRLVDGLALTRLEAEYSTLVKELSVWAREVPSHHEETGMALSDDEVLVQRGKRQRFAEELHASWSRQASNASPDASPPLEYKLDILGHMPKLSAVFSHVSEVNFSSAFPLSGSEFLASFPGVRYLTLTGFAMKSLPVEIFQMRDLVTLTLDNCQIRLSEATVEGLAHIETLTLLDLSENPLGLTPDVSFMQRLDSLYLSNAGLTETPIGLFDIESLAYADLRRNVITNLPQELFDVPDVREVNYNFRNNPLDDESLQRVTAYRDGAGLDRKVLIQVDGDEWVPQQNAVLDGVDSGLESSDEG
ncbi:leucine-rich repeat domain-containing protein [Pseudomonas sp. R1-1]|uniref:leucine-rich repeat domain-containing protein n=1 Tax=Pseudomonas sp. R1-1 TaxID=1602529 RepID=UPI003DA9D980